MANPLEKLPSPDVSAKRIYAYRLNLTELAGRVKVGETERSVHSRVTEQVNTAAPWRMSANRAGRMRRARRWAYLHRPRSPRGTGQLKEFETTSQMAEWWCSAWSTRREDRAYRTAHMGQSFTRARITNILSATRASRGGEGDSCLLPVALGGRHARRAALPLEREDALWQDFHSLPACQEDERQAGAWS